MTPTLPVAPPAAEPEAAALVPLPEAAAEVVPDEEELEPQAASSSAPAATIPIMTGDFRRMDNFLSDEDRTAGRPSVYAGQPTRRLNRITRATDPFKSR
jgi:hypothetical protein